MIRIWRTSVGFGIAGLMTGLLLLTPCATAGGPPVAEVPPEGQETPRVEEVATPRAPAGPEATPPEAAHIPAAETSPALEGPAAEAKPEVLVEPQPPQEVPVFQQAGVVRPQAPAKVPEVPARPAANPPVTAEAPKAPAPPPEVPDLEKRETLPGLSKRVSLDLRQMDIVAVMKFLAEKGDLNIVTGKNVGGRVTLSLKDVTIQGALDIIALTHELAYVLQIPIIHVMTDADYQRLFGSSFADQRQVKRLQLQYADATNVAVVLGNMKSAIGRVIADAQTRTIVLIDVPEKLAQMVEVVESMDRATELQTQVFELQYGKAEDVKAEVDKVLTPTLGAVRLDKRTNTLVVTDLPPKVQEIRQVIHAFDRKTREVNIETKIIEVRLDDKFQMGVDWEVLFKNLNNLTVKHTFPITPPLVSSAELIIGTLADDNFTAAIELLETVGRVNILSTPRIAVVENEEATILVGTREAFVTSVVTQTANAATTAEEVTFVDVGIQLKVTPIINRDGFITMKIKPEVSSVSRTLTTALGNEIPIVDTSTAQTTVMVRDGTTIVIAGLMKDEMIDNEEKVPILGDIPIIGFAFRSKEEEVTKSELIIFLTPTIISGQESVAGVGSALGKTEDEKQE